MAVDSSSKHRTIVRAVHQYIPKRDLSNDDHKHELGFERGELLTIIGAVAEDGSYLAERRGAVPDGTVELGFIPSNFVELIDAAREPESSSATAPPSEIDEAGDETEGEAEIIHADSSDLSAVEGHHSKTVLEPAIEDNRPEAAPDAAVEATDSHGTVEHSCRTVALRPTSASWAGGLPLSTLWWKPPTCQTRTGDVQFAPPSPNTDLTVTAKIAEIQQRYPELQFRRCRRPRIYNARQSPFEQYEVLGDHLSLIGRGGVVLVRDGECLHGLECDPVYRAILSAEKL